MAADANRRLDEKIQVLGTGCFKPERLVDNSELEKIVDTSDDWIVARTGIRERRIVENSITTSDIAFKASQYALTRAGITPDQLDLIIVATVTPDMLTPSTACLLQDKLEAYNAAAFDVSAGCTGFMYGLVAAEKFLLDAKYRYALVVGAETLSKVLDWTDRNTCVIFADGAGAMVLRRGAGANGILASYLGADGRNSALITIPGGGSLMPASNHSVSNRMHFIKMNGREVYKYALKVIPECANQVLEQASLEIEDVDHVIFHQANLRIIENGANRLGVPLEKVLTNIEWNGNTSSASIPVLIAEAEDEGRFKPGEILLMVGFGAGMTTGSVLMRWGN